MVSSYTNITHDVTIDSHPRQSPDKRGGLGVGPATPPRKNSLATETETREKTAPGGRREAVQATGLMKDGD